MSVLNEPDVLRRSMLAGAREFLVKPFSLDESADVGSERTPADDPDAPHGGVHGIARQTQTIAKPTGTGQAHRGRQPQGRGGTLGDRHELSPASLRQLSHQSVALVDANVSFGDIGVMMNVTDAKTILDARPLPAADRRRTDQHDPGRTHDRGARCSSRRRPARSGGGHPRPGRAQVPSRRCVRCSSSSSLTRAPASMT